MGHYILMCDIINSSEKKQEKLISDFKSCVAFINATYQKSILSPLTITLGDEFQGIIANMRSSVEIIIALEEFIVSQNLSLKLRYVLHFGEISTEINTKIAYEMLGPGLTYSRNLINGMKGKNERFCIHISSITKNIILKNAFFIFQNIVDKWNLEKDYLLISNFFDQKSDYKSVADKIAKNRSLVWKREKTLGIPSYKSAKEIILAIS